MIDEKVVGALDVSYGYVVDQQPIGRELFRQFCKVKRPQYSRYITFLDDATRYEIAADEHRVDLAFEVAKRYLGLCTESQREDSGGGGGCDSDGGKCDDDSGIGGDTKKLSNHDDPEKSLTGSNSVTTNTINNEKDEFVLDVLNDDMVGQIRTKLSTGSKELFEASITAVRAFLAGEPFREFEASMYFHSIVLKEVIDVVSDSMFPDGTFCRRIPPQQTNGDNLELLFKTEELKAEVLKTEELKTEELKMKKLKTEELKMEKLKTEELKMEKLKTEELKAEDFRCNAEDVS
uniref:RGS domain-containing protein n=1 Tax=Anopheles melas TaxID=34690 RepID=A0A182TVU3_9DIPT